MEINLMIDKAFREMGWSELAEAPVDALRGVSKSDAEKLKAAFNIDTVRDLATLKFILWAQEIVRLADEGSEVNHPLTPKSLRAVVETHYYSYWSAQYKAHQNDVDLDVGFLGEYEQERRRLKEAPLAVQESHNYYFEMVEQADWGGVRYYLIPIDLTEPEGPALYLVRVTTDGDDGWVELYDKQGIELGVGRTYIELVGWGERDAIREMVSSGDFPADLDDKHNQTLWGK